MRLIGVTGAKGILGTKICLSLNKTGENYTIFDGDITDRIKVHSWVSHNKITDLIHLAAKVQIDEVEQGLGSAIATNIQGTLNIINECVKSQHLRYIFFASTSHVYSNRVKNPRNENDELDPINTYGLTKFCGENIVKTLCQPNCISYTIGRIFSFYDRNQKPGYLYSNLLQKIKKNKPGQAIQVFGANNVRNFSTSDEIASKILKLVTLRYDGVINIGSTNNLTVGEFCRRFIPKDIQVEEHKDIQPSILLPCLKKFNELE